MKFTRLIWAVPLVAVLGLALVWRFSSVSVGVSSLKRGPAVLAVYATGTVEPTVMVEVAPRVSARLDELLVDEGAEVTKGQVLARLDSAEPKAVLLEARVQEGQFEQELERVVKLVERRAVSQDEVDKARARLDMARAARAAAEARLGYVELTAPSAGRVIKRDGELGELLTTNDVLFWLSGEEPLRITAEVDEEDISQVKTGARVLVRADAFPGEVFEGQVLQITPKGDPIARSYRVRMSIPEESPLRIGMTTETNIIVSERQDALLAPTAAVQGSPKGGSSQGGWFVWVFDQGKVSKRQLKIGSRGDQTTEILEGLTDGEQVVVDKFNKLSEGLSVRAQLQE